MAGAKNKKAAVEGAAPNSRVANESKEVVLLGKTRRVGERNNISWGRVVQELTAGQHFSRL